MPKNQTVLERMRKKRRYVKKDPEAYNAQALERIKDYTWKPGVSGNTTGRPRGNLSLTTELKMYLRRHPEDMAKIIKSLVKEGLSGNIIAIKETFDRVDGKVTETHRLEGTLPIVLNFMPAATMLAQGDKPALPSHNDIEGELVEQTNQDTERY